MLLDGDGGGELLRAQWGSEAEGLGLMDLLFEQDIDIARLRQNDSRRS